MTSMLKIIETNTQKTLSPLLLIETNTLLVFGDAYVKACVTLK